ncbi:MAG: hypothetical protein ACOYNL_06080, partial [Rickettsiales bacterium]
FIRTRLDATRMKKLVTVFFLSMAPAVAFAAHGDVSYAVDGGQGFQVAVSSSAPMYPVYPFTDNSGYVVTNDNDSVYSAPTNSQTASSSEPAANGPKPMTLDAD